MEIKVLARQGLGIREIAREMQMSRNTVRRYLRDEAAATPERRAPRMHKLDPYRTYIQERLQARSRAVVTKLAGFPAIKTLEEFDFAFGHGATITTLFDQLAGVFIKHRPRQPAHGP